MNKAQREKIAKRFTDIAAGYGATVERRDRDAIGGYRASVDLLVRLNGVGGILSIGDLHDRGAAGLISWHNDYSSGRAAARDFSSAFNCAARDYAATRPHHKATSYGDWDKLTSIFSDCLKLAAAGEAFIVRESVA